MSNWIPIHLGRDRSKKALAVTVRGLQLTSLACFQHTKGVQGHRTKDLKVCEIYTSVWRMRSVKIKRQIETMKKACICEGRLL